MVVVVVVVAAVVAAVVVMTMLLLALALTAGATVMAVVAATKACGWGKGGMNRDRPVSKLYNNTTQQSKGTHQSPPSQLHFSELYPPCALQ
jgi:hypothetical protein